MRIQLMSDLHFEFHDDRGREWISSQNADDVDVLILAGDIAEVRDGHLAEVLEAFVKKFPDVVFVPGNHEYYGSTIADASTVFEDLNAQLETLHILRRQTVNIRGQRFVGASLWFPERFDEEHSELENRLNDFHKIGGGFRGWVYEEAKRDAQFLVETVLKGDVVITHHIPSARGVAAKWQSVIDGFGRFFVHPLPEDVIQRSTLWCHGHGHDSVQTRIGEHTLSANPFGYLGVEENPGYNPSLIFEL